MTTSRSIYMIPPGLLYTDLNSIMAGRCRISSLSGNRAIDTGGMTRPGNGPVTPAGNPRRMNKWSGTWSLPLLLFLGSSNGWRPGCGLVAKQCGLGRDHPVPSIFETDSCGMGPNAFYTRIAPAMDTTSSFTLSAASHHRPGETTVNSCLLT